MNTEFLKWLSTSLVLSGVLLTNLNIYPLKIFIHSAGVASWTVAGILMQDKAIATNFGLQIPIFAVGYVHLFYNS